ncbi:MAG: hypothetical protein ACM359_18080 [Bacillota bacterium]
MRQRITTYLLLLPLLLLAFCLYLWLRSYIPGGLYCRVYDGRLLLFWASGLYAEHLEEAALNGPELAELVDQLTTNRFNAVNRRSLGFQFVVSQRSTGKYRHEYNLLAIPFSAIILVLMPISLGSWLAFRQRRRHLRPGYCVRCGYDLRASKGRCPECGEAMPTSDIQNIVIPRSS